jgi:hypothetical protein
LFGVADVSAQRFGYGDGYVAQTSDIQDLPTTLLNGSALGVIVMDHTLSQEERTAGVQITGQLAPDVQTVVLHPAAGTVALI